MLRQTFLAAPRLEGIQEEDDHSGTDSNNTQNFKKKFQKFQHFFQLFYYKISVFRNNYNEQVIYLFVKAPELSMGKISRTFLKHTNGITP